MSSHFHEKQGLFIRKKVPEAILPSMGSDEAAGYDLYASKETSIPPKGKGLVDTGIEMAIPFGAYGRIAPRSGLAWKNFIDVGAGVIDSDYRGEVKVLLFNFGEVDFKVSPGDRIAQIIIENVVPTAIKEVEELPSSKRGAGGFGSTGVSSSNRTAKRVPEELIREEVSIESIGSVFQKLMELQLEISQVKREMETMMSRKAEEMNQNAKEEKKELIEKENDSNQGNRLLVGADLAIKSEAEALIKNNKAQVV